MSKFYSSNFKIGILGGGQLGRMLIQEAANYDVRIYILDSDENAPSKNICHQFTNGSITNFDDVYNFGKDKDVVTIEIENVNVDALERLESEGIKVYPQPKLIRMVQDKGLQKKFYFDNQIPTAEFRLITSQNDLKEHTDFLPFVQKLRRGGYDGKGVQSMVIEDDFSKGFDSPSVLEKFVDFEKELSVIVARNESGEIKSFPVVELEFNSEANLVEFLFAPANVEKKIEESAQKIARDLIERMGLIGILAVELFLTNSGEIIVNEIAPRPHNSGHQTIEANFTSQFEQHLRAILNLPLGSTAAILPCVMINLLGEKNHTGDVKYDGFEKIISQEGVYPHIYGKTTTKPFRKMGHITVLNASLEGAKKIALQCKHELKVISEK